MKTLQDLLTRISKSLGRDVVGRGVVLKCIKEVAGFDLNPEDIAIKGDTLEVVASPTKKNEIKLHETEILSEITKTGGLRLSRILYK